MASSCSGVYYAARARRVPAVRAPDDVQKIGRDHGHALANVGMLPRPTIKLAVRMTRPGGDDLTADAFEFDSRVVVEHFDDGNAFRQSQVIVTAAGPGDDAGPLLFVQSDIKAKRSESLVAAVARVNI